MILSELNIISVKLERRTNQEGGGKKIYEEEGARLAEKERKYNDVKNQSDDNDKD